MKAFAGLTTCMLAAVGGCQVSGEAEVDTQQRPAAEVKVDTGYTISATATRDTEWRASTDASAARGTLRAGDRVMLNRAPDTSMEWQPARTTDGRTVYVRPADFRLTTTTP